MRFFFISCDAIFKKMCRNSGIPIILICFMLTAAGCSRRRAGGMEGAISPGCLLLAGAEDRQDTIRIALDKSIDPEHAPVPLSDSERILFNHLYETLITIDCEGRLHPGLAYEWYAGGGGKKWTFLLRGDATFWDGSGVTAQDVVDCWQSSGVEPYIWEAGVDSVSAEGTGAVTVHFAARHIDIPRELSGPPFAVARTGPRQHWPIGTSRCLIESEPPWSSLMYRRPFTVHPASGSETPVLIFLDPGPGEMSDPRDLLEGQVDVMMTSDPDVIEYASTRSHLEAIPLPWARTYILLSTTRVRNIRLGDSPAGIDREFADGLARDVVPGIARGHEAPGWWRKIDRCAAAAGGAEPPGRGSPSAFMPEPEMPRRIMFDEDDPVARGLAERIVALGAAGAGSSPEAAGLGAAVPELAEGTGGIIAAGISDSDLRSRIEEGNDFAYIIWLPIRASNPCTVIRQLVDDADWLSQLGDDLGDALLPLVDTRKFAIVREGTGGLSVDWHGNIYVTKALNRRATPPPGR
jgi:hypothetical protein